VERFDAVVVGAGPAGSATAIRLARAGARVLLADRASFPRDKPCGGGLTGRAVKELPVDVTPVVEDVVRTFEVRLGYRKRFERRSDAPLVLMTRRRRLDAFLVEQAAEAGAVFRDGVTVEGVTVGPDGATLQDRCRRDSRASRQLSSGSCPAATGGSSRKRATRTSASAAGRRRGRACASTCAGSARSTASTSRP
jgi:flavin-dependent dehydrogenase